ncbi:hypothetical protein Hanom_Chr00s164814g01826421 [Helianthus anomalus]
MKVIVRKTIPLIEEHRIDSINVLYPTKNLYTLTCTVAKLDPNDRGSKTYIPKDFYRTGGSKTYIPKNFYTKTTYMTLLSEKFGGSGAPPRPFYPSPMYMHIVACH